MIEYKNPHDELNERVLYKIVAYANYLIGNAAHEGDVPPEQVTISIFRSDKNKALFTELERKGKLTSAEKGIYRINGITELPFQIVITSELEGSEYAAYRALTDSASEEDIKQVAEDTESEHDEKLREWSAIVLDLIATKNPTLFAEIIRSDDMKYPGLMEAFKDDVDERVNAVRKDEHQQTMILSIRNVMDSFHVDADKAMDSLKIPQSERDIYSEMLEPVE